MSESNVSVVNRSFTNQPTNQLDLPKGEGPAFPVLFLQNCILSALAYDRCANLRGSAHLDCVVDKSMVNVAALLAGQIAQDGRVAINVDPRLANDTGMFLSAAPMERHARTQPSPVSVPTILAAHKERMQPDKPQELAVA